MVPLGSQGLRVTRLGLGVMSAAFYGSGDAATDEAHSLAAIDKAVELSAPQPAFLDTAFIYSNPNGLHSESIIAKAIAKHGRDKFIIATKFGSSPTGGAPDSSTATIHKQYAESVARLGCTPDLYYQHRPDATRPTAEVVGDLKQMVAEGKFKYIGLSECTPQELRAAHAVHPISAIQMEWSLAERGIEKHLVPVARELGVGIVCYSPLARGLLTTQVQGREGLAEGDRRAMLPRFAEASIAQNVQRASALGALAAKLNCTPAQFSLAWLLAQGKDVFPIPGTKTVGRVEENWGAIALVERLTKEQLAEVEGLGLTMEGGRYGEAGMKLVFENRM